MRWRSVLWVLAWALEWRRTMASKRCDWCLENWPNREAYASCPICARPTGWSSVAAMAGDVAERLVAGAKEFAADWARAEDIAGRSSLSVADVIDASRQKREAA